MSKKKALFNKMVDISQVMLDERQAVSPAKLLNQLCPDGYMPEWELAVNIGLLRRALVKTRGTTYESVPLTIAFFEKFGEAPETPTDIEECLPWGRGHRMYGFCLANGTELGVAWRKQRVKIVTGAHLQELRILQQLHESGEVMPEGIEDVLYDAKQLAGPDVAKLVESAKAWVLRLENGSSLNGP